MTTDSRQSEKNNRIFSFSELSVVVDGIRESGWHGRQEWRYIVHMCGIGCLHWVTSPERQLIAVLEVHHVVMATESNRQEGKRAYAPAVQWEVFLVEWQAAKTLYYESAPVFFPSISILHWPACHNFAVCFKGVVHIIDMIWIVILLF